MEGAGLEAELGERLELGVGIAAATLTLTRAFERDRPDRVLLFGVAGAFPLRHRPASAPLTVGDVCLVGEDRFGDLGVELDPVHEAGGFRDLAAMGLGEVGPWPMDLAWTHDAAERLGCPVAQAVTVAAGSGTERRSERIAARSDAAVESMEGAAVAAVCAAYGVPLLQLRSISNFTGDRARGGWDLDTAVARVQESMRQLLAREQ